MDLVSRKEFFKLGKNNKAFEDDDITEELDYSSFLDGYQNYFDTCDDPYKTYNNFVKKSWLPENLNAVKYIAEGSSRAAYRCLNGLCLKIAMDESGLAQNKQEIRNVGGSKVEAKYSCFTTNHDYDKLYYGSILTECCTQCEYEDFEEYLGVDLLVFCEILKNRFESGKFDNLEDLHTYYMKYGENNEQYFIENVLESHDGQFDVMKDLFKFYESDTRNVNRMLIEDLAQIENWGLAYRFGEPCLIILDAGFSKDVQEQWY